MWGVVYDRKEINFSQILQQKYNVECYYKRCIFFGCVMSVSKKLIDFLDKEIDPLIGDNMKKTRFSKTSRGFLTKIFRNMELARASWIDVSSKSAVKYKKAKIVYGENYRDLPDFAIKEIENTLSKESGFHCKFYLFGTRHVDVYMYGKQLTHAFFETAIKRIYLWFYVAFLYAPRECSQHLNCYIYLTDLQKYLPSGHGGDGSVEPIGIAHANTAFTTACREHTDINIFRYEEWFKVLIHESFHCLGLDFSTMDTRAATAEVLKMYHVNSTVNLSETYCEVFAELLNVMFILFYGVDNIDADDDNDGMNMMDNLIEKTEQLINHERMFSLFQCAKVLHYYNITYEELIKGDNIVVDKFIQRKNSVGTKSRPDEDLTTEQSPVSNLSRFKERTNVLSYYIIKTVLLYNIDEFIEWCDKYNEKGGLNFNKKNSLADYCYLIREHYNKKGYIHMLNVLNVWNKKRGKKQSAFELKTMRMSLLE